MTEPGGSASEASADDDARARALSRQHLRFGWWGLLVFACLGIALESLHGFKVRWYLDVANEARRHLFTLAHAHGTLLSLIHVAFGLCVAALPGWDEGRRRSASRALLGAVVLMPGGFLLGGVFVQGGDPGLGIALLPLGAVLLVAALWLTARQTSR